MKQKKQFKIGIIFFVKLFLKKEKKNAFQIEVLAYNFPSIFNIK